MGPPFYNKVAIPVALLLLSADRGGPAAGLAQDVVGEPEAQLHVARAGRACGRRTDGRFGVRPWTDIAYFYALMAAMLSALVILTVASEFIRGGRVISRHTGQNLLASMVHLFHRNTRRYGGYIVHFGVAVVIIGILGTPFNQDKEKEMGFGDKMTIGPYTLVCESYTQDDNPNYSNEWAIINVFKGDRKIETMYPERRFYKASQQPQTLPRIRSTYKEDLYLTYEGLNEQTGRPIIKAHLNPLVMWIWVGVLIMIGGTVLALIPNALPVRVHRSGPNPGCSGGSRRLIRRFQIEDCRFQIGMTPAKSRCYR